MHLNDKIYVAGHSGLVGSALVRELKKEGYNNLLLRTHDELDLTNQVQVQDFFKKVLKYLIILFRISLYFKYDSTEIDR